jgi:GMP synthase-like glutamine amidotransferase
MDVLVLQHIACEPPGVYEDVLRARGAAITRVELDEGEPLPDWRRFGAIVAMGGPMSVNDDDEHPWLVAEKRAIREAVEAGRSFWGACLGVQLLAVAFGARVYPGPAPEVGVMEVALTSEGRDDPVVGVLPPRFPCLQWHGDTFDLPPGGVRLMASSAYLNQGFRLGERAYGVQFHLEVDDAMGEEWSRIPAYVEYAERVLGEGGSEMALAAFRAAAPGMRDLARQVFSRWADLARISA